MLKWNSLAFRCNNSLRAGLPKSTAPWRGAWGCLQEWAGCGPKLQSRFVQSLIDQREELIIFQAVLQIGSQGISVRIPEEMFLMVISVFPVTYKIHTHTNKAEASLEKNPAHVKRCTYSKFHGKGLIHFQHKWLPLPFHVCSQQGVRERDAGHVYSPASTLENSKGPRSVSITLFTCLLLWVSWWQSKSCLFFNKPLIFQIEFREVAV